MENHPFLGLNQLFQEGFSTVVVAQNSAPDVNQLFPRGDGFNSKLFGLPEAMEPSGCSFP